MKTNFNILKKTAPCLQNQEVILTELERDDEGQELSSVWASPNTIKLDACIRYFIENHDARYRHFNENLLQEENDLKIEKTNLTEANKYEGKKK